MEMPQLREHRPELPKYRQKDMRLHRCKFLEFWAHRGDCRAKIAFIRVRKTQNLPKTQKSPKNPKKTLKTQKFFLAKTKIFEHYSR